MTFVPAAGVRAIFLFFLGFAVLSTASLAHALGNFGVVAPNAIYRSEGPASTEELARAHAAYGFGSILNLEQGWNVLGLRLNQERAWCEKNEVAFINFKMSNIIRPSADQLRHAVEKLVMAPKPVLVHCFHGRDRTGLVIAAYRMMMEGWSYEEAYAEMLRYGHNPRGFLGNWKLSLIELAETLK